MRSIKFVTILVVLFTSLLFAQKSYKKLTFPALHEIKIPKIKEEKLLNGMALYMVEDHSLPIIKIYAMVGVRSLFDPSNKVGLARLTGLVMRTGGTKNFLSDEIDEKLESVGATIESSIGTDYGEVELWVLKEHFDEILPIFVDIIRYPTFTEDKIELAKVILKTEIARCNDDPFNIAIREYRKLIYGKDSPYARTIEDSTINNISRDDIIAFYKKYFYPNNIKLGIIGDFNSKKMRKKLKEAFGNWDKKEIESYTIPEVTYHYHSSVNLVDKAGLKQTTILMGHIGGIMSNPDIPALTVMNEILGGGFTGRLYKNIREAKGLAYLIFGRYNSEYDHPGIFYLGVQTEAKNTVEVVEDIKNEVKKISEEKVTDEELRQAKNSYLNSFVFNFDTKERILQRIMTYDYYGYPRDFINQLKEQIESVTKDNILRVVNEYIHPEDMIILVVGDADKIRDLLTSLGKVNEIEVH
ncbi:MAG: pitrilysin family protein [bacterium]|nr:pitrilysin family protein [bacterium]